MNNNVVVVTSLPRTGTVSMCRMLDFLGYETVHAPLSEIYNKIKPGRGFADTPCFAPSCMEIMRQLREDGVVDVKFIYIDRDFKSWYDSMTISTNLLRTYRRLCREHNDNLSEGQLEDLGYYGEVFGNIEIDYPDERKAAVKRRFDIHRQLATSSKYSPLVYKFNQGWGPLCDFLGLNIPDKNIPHLHKKHIGVQDGQ